ncbi:MAG TPA: TerC family protein [Rubricoccaceae bacterium]|nr:TerC family protein [Rubricoccaceae bacterium]
MFDWLADPQAWAALATLTALEIVLGIDNIIFISILTARLPLEQQARARTTGLGLAMGMRIALLLAISWVMGLTDPVDWLPPIPFLSEEPVHGEGIGSSPAFLSGRDVILLVGGLFLLWKATKEIHEKLEGEGEHTATRGKAASFTGVLIQIALLDIVFSLDSVITAVGMADEIGVMIVAVVLAVAVMLFAAGPISNFVHKHPTLKMLALAFLILIGVTLVAEGLGQHISKGYIYTAMAFSFIVEMLNIRAGRKAPPVELREPYAADGTRMGPLDTSEVRQWEANRPG